MTSHDFGTPVGVVQIRGPLDDLPGRRPLLQFTGRGYETHDEYTHAGELLKDGLRVAAAKRTIDIRSEGLQN